MARPADFSDKLHFHYYPAQSIYQRPGQAIFKQKPAQWPPGPTAVLTTGGLFSAKACPMAVLSTRGPMAVLSTPSPMAVLSRQRQRMARPPDFSRKLQFRYYPAQSMYQRPGQAVFSTNRPNGRRVNGRSNGRFINARPNGRPSGRFIKAHM